MVLNASTKAMAIKNNATYMSHTPAASAASVQLLRSA
jgi:hypothetical protein